MGHGIAQVLAYAVPHVAMYDVSKEILENAHSRISQSLQLLQRNGLKLPVSEADILDRIKITCDLSEAVSDAQFVIEAAPEELELKQQLFADLERETPNDAVLATNSSGLSLAKVGVLLKPEARTRLVGSHFFIPAQIVPLVEVSRSAMTKAGIFDRTVHLWARCGKKPIRVQVDLPGYVANRLQTALTREAIHLLANGVATAADVDEAVRSGFGLRYLVSGPLEQRDITGLDLHLKVMKELWPELNQDTDPHTFITEKVACGELGVRGGRGFHDWTDGDFDEITASRTEALVNAMARLGVDFFPE